MRVQLFSILTVLLCKLQARKCIHICIPVVSIKKDTTPMASAGYQLPTIYFYDIFPQKFCPLLIFAKNLFKASSKGILAKSCFNPKESQSS